MDSRRATIFQQPTANLLAPASRGHLGQHWSISQNQPPLFDRLGLLLHNQVAALCGRTVLSREEGKERLDPYEEAHHLSLCTSAEEAIQSVETLGGAPLAALATALWREARDRVMARGAGHFSASPGRAE